MAKKITIRGASKTRADETGLALLPAAAQRSLVPAPDAPGDLVTRQGDTTRIVGRHYLAGDLLIPALEIYYVDGLKPETDGPWLGEADKVAWRDEATGYECIMLRDTAGAYLGGYVGVPEGHPLYGFSSDALPYGLGIEVHGGISYAEICQDGPTPERRIIPDESRRVCHVPPTPIRYVPTAHATDYRVEDEHVWWFGFACNGVSDVVPGQVRHGEQSADAAIAQTYRDDAYVCAEVVSLAAQLRAIQDGQPLPARTGPPLPPRGLDPTRES